MAGQPACMFPLVRVLRRRVVDHGGLPVGPSRQSRKCRKEGARGVTSAVCQPRKTHCAWSSAMDIAATKPARAKIAGAKIAYVETLRGIACILLVSYHIIG